MNPAAAEVPKGWQQLFADSFDRTLSGTWGRSWALSGAVSRAGVTRTAAEADLSPGQSLTATVKWASAADVDLSQTVQATGSGGATFDAFHTLILRQQDDGSGYEARLRTGPGARASLVVTRLNGTTATWLAGVALPEGLGADVPARVELQVTGSSPVAVRARAWAVGGDKPGWQLVHRDGDAARVVDVGAVAVRSYLEHASDQVRFHTDDLSVGGSGRESIPAGPPPDESPRGARPVGTAAYPVPPDAVYVSPDGSDNNPGTRARPVRTARVASILAPDGGTIVLRTGVYHESLRVEPGKSLTIQNYPSEPVWFDGSTIVNGWTKQGSYWLHRGWTTEFSSMMGHDAAFKARFIGANPMAADPDQLFLNGEPLRQVASPGEVTEGTFYVSDTGNALVIGSDPTGKEVRVSDLGRAIAIAGPNSVIQGIGVRRYATGYERDGAIKMAAAGTTIRQVVIRDVATIGLAVTGANKTIDHVTVRRAGMLGIAGYHNDNSVITNSVTSGNNTEGFKDAPVAGGMKFCAARTITAKNNEASNNAGTGIWFDVSVYDMVIVGNTTVDNTKYGIEVEVSDKGIVADNLATGGEAGITLFDAGNFEVFNNNVGGSTMAGIKLIQDERRQADLTNFPEARDPRYAGVVDPTVPWLTRNIRVSNNVFGDGGWFQLFALDGRTDRAVDTWRLTVDGNLFNPRPTRKHPTMVAWGQGDRATVERYETPEALAAAKGRHWRNAQVGESTALADMGPARKRHSSVAVPIPREVAAATGMPEGWRHIGVH